MWSTIAVGIVLLGLTFWRVACPASLSLEGVRSISAERFLPTLRGEARCWVFFIGISLFFVLTGLLLDNVVSRWVRRESSDAERRRV
jgi:hypothetical protein